MAKVGGSAIRRWRSCPIWRSSWGRPVCPCRWSWRDGRAALDAAGRLVDTEFAERRNLILFNPVEGNTYATVRTMIAAYQALRQKRRRARAEKLRSLAAQRLRAKAAADDDRADDDRAGET